MLKSRGGQIYNGYNNLPNKKGQVTIFIIVAIILVVAVGLFLLIRSGIVSDIFTRAPQNPEADLQVCLEDRVYEAVELLGQRGGYMYNSLNATFSFPGENRKSDISYLCYTRADEDKCIIQTLVLNHLEKEIHDYLGPEMEGCLTELEQSYSNAGYTVEVKRGDFEVALNPERITIESKQEIRLTKSDETTVEKDFTFSFYTELYELGFIAQRIVQGEANNCEFDYVDYILAHPHIDIDYFKASDSVEFYKIINKNTNELFKLAIRGCI